MIKENRFSMTIRGIIPFVIMGVLQPVVSCRNASGENSDTDNGGTPVVDCRSWDQDDDWSCTSNLCLMQMQYELCENSNEYCDGLEQCFADFFYCFEPECPIGERMDQDQMEYYLQCFAEYGDCEAALDTDTTAPDTGYAEYTGPDPYAEFDCEEAGLNEEMCDYIFCGHKDVWDGAFYECSGSESGCQPHWQCTLEYFHCRNEACPSGTLIEDMDVVLAHACEELLSACN